VPERLERPGLLARPFELDQQWLAPRQQEDPVRPTVTARRLELQALKLPVLEGVSADLVFNG